jgi:CRISPR-associated protein Csm4
VRNHTVFRYSICLQTALATPMAGDTLFGHICWALRELQGEDALARALSGYTAGNPFAVVSDAMPAGYMPRPLLPPQFIARAADVSQRKAFKSLQWIPLEQLQQPIDTWLQAALHQQPPSSNQQNHVHNTISRLTGSTGTGIFAPYSVQETWHQPDAPLHLYIALDESILSAELFSTLLQHIGRFGFGRDASTGLGKFSVEDRANIPMPTQSAANAWLSLAPCAPQGLGYDGQNSFWQPLTRYGRHGNRAALSGQPFKSPVLLAARGSVFSTGQSTALLGQGLGGKGELSRVIPATVHQGYAPAIGIQLPALTSEVAL